MGWLIGSGSALADDMWPEIEFPPEAKVELIAEESWVTGMLPMRIYQVTGSRKDKRIFEWFAAEWLKTGSHCLSDSEPLKTLNALEADSAKKANVLSCVIDDHIVVGQFSSGLQESALISISAPARAVQRPASPTVKALQSYTGGKIMSYEYSNFGIKQATTLAIETRGQPDFVVESLSGALLRNDWRVERLGGLPGSGHMGRELVAVLRHERILVSVQAIDNTRSGVVVVIETEGGQ
ncbi:hypothetical protein [Allohahella sp. A8]|uniref:hypothetical protein n=1 Tax=Allohahella sp. A8 TaxID=3141461 RepID=UPI003A7FB6B6